MEVYQWLFRQNGHKVSSLGYFVYCNGTTDREAFDGRLEFNIKLIPYEGNDSWIEDTLHNIQACLLDESMPARNAECEYCAYRQAAKEYE